MKKKGLVFIIIPIAVVVFGLIGFCGYLGYTFYEGLMASLKFLKVEFGGVTNNVFVEISRCLGILFYFSLLYAVAYALFDVVKMFTSVRSKDSVAVHGDSAMAAFCAKNIHKGKHCVHSDSKESFRAKRQIIWFDDDAKSMQFYETNKAALTKDEVYIALSNVPTDGKMEENVHLFNVDENIAVTYWEKNYLTEPKKIVIIGSGNLAEQMMEEGLLMNVFAKVGGVRYHMIGDFDLYRAMHPGLQEAAMLTQDELTFSKNPWYQQMEVIGDADRIILADDDKTNTQIASQLVNFGIRKEIHLRAASDETKALFQDGNFTIFGTVKEILGEDGENLFQDGIHQEGKLLDALYGVLSDALDDEKAEETFSVLYSKPKKQWAEENARWKDLSGFVKRSNYSAAKHGVVKRDILKKALSEGTAGCSYEEYIAGGLKGARAFWKDPANKALVNDLQEIEHLRWWRLYLLSNFTYKEDVKNEDKWMLRQNKNMKDYEQLDEVTQGYDGMYYWLLAFQEK